MVNRQGMPVQLIRHTKPYNNRNLQTDGALRYLVYESDNNIGPLTNWFALSSGVFCSSGQAL